MIAIDRPQRGHNLLAHGSAVGVGGGWHLLRAFSPRCDYQCHLTEHSSRYRAMGYYVTPPGSKIRVGKFPPASPGGRRQNSPWQRRGCWAGKRRLTGAARSIRIVSNTPRRRPLPGLNFSFFCAKMRFLMQTFNQVMGHEILISFKDPIDKRHSRSNNSFELTCSRRHL